MERECVREKVIAFIKDLIDEAPEQITEDCALMEDLDISSMEIMTMISDIEQEFSVVLEETDTRNIVTIRDLIECVYDKVQHIKK